eukprot:1976944-Pyramimonas_sp.AAC.1
MRHRERTADDLRARPAGVADEGAQAGGAAARLADCAGGPGAAERAGRGGSCQEGMPAQLVPLRDACQALVPEHPGGVHRPADVARPRGQARLREDPRGQDALVRHVRPRRKGARA